MKRLDPGPDAADVIGEEENRRDSQQTRERGGRRSVRAKSGAGPERSGPTHRTS